MKTVINLFLILFTASFLATIVAFFRWIKWKRQIKKNFFQKNKNKDFTNLTPEEIEKSRKSQIVERKTKLMPVIVFSIVTIALLIISIGLGANYYV